MRKSFLSDAIRISFPPLSIVPAVFIYFFLYVEKQQVSVKKVIVPVKLYLIQHAFDRVI